MYKYLSLYKDFSERNVCLVSEKDFCFFRIFLLIWGRGVLLGEEFLGKFCGGT